jgi:hypothetical protein
MEDKQRAVGGALYIHLQNIGTLTESRFKCCHRIARNIASASTAMGGDEYAACLFLTNRLKIFHWLNLAFRD